MIPFRPRPITELASRLRTTCLLSLATLVAGLAVVAGPAEAASGEYYVWAKWRLGHAPYTCQAGASWVRPNVRPRVPASWWKRLEQYQAMPCSPADEQPVASATPIAEPALDAREAALRDAVNAARARQGLAAIPVGAGLERAARDHTADMVRFGYLGHDWNNGTPFGTWVNRYTTCKAGEIIAWRSPQQTAGNAVQQWLNSPGHRAALLAPNWAVMGVELGQRHATIVFAAHC